VESKLFDVSYVAKRLGTNAKHIYQLANAGVLPCVRVGRLIKFSSEVIEAFIANGGRGYSGGWRQADELHEAPAPSVEVE
jgi:excisionase family DNA binding protein